MIEDFEFYKFEVRPKVYKYLFKNDEKSPSYKEG